MHSSRYEWCFMKINTSESFVAHAHYSIHFLSEARKSSTHIFIKMLVLRKVFLSYITFTKVRNCLLLLILLEYEYERAYIMDLHNGGMR